MRSCALLYWAGWEAPGAGRRPPGAAALSPLPAVLVVESRLHLVRRLPHVPEAEQAKDHPPGDPHTLQHFLLRHRPMGTVQ